MSMSKNNNINGKSKSKYELKEERITKLTAELLKLGKKYGIGKAYEKSKSNDVIQDKTIDSLSDFVNDIFNLKADDGSDININKDDLDVKVDSLTGISESELDPKLVTYVKFALLHKAEQEYIFEKNFGFEPKGFSYEELRNINNASLDHDRHVAFMNKTAIYDRNFINIGFKPRVSNYIYNIADDYVRHDLKNEYIHKLLNNYTNLKEESVGNENYIAKVIRTKSRKHDIKKVAAKAGIDLNKDEQKLVNKLMKQMDKYKNISSGFESAYRINNNKLEQALGKLEKDINMIKENKEEMKSWPEKFNELEEQEAELSSNKEKLDKLIRHVVYRQKTRETTERKIILNTHISMKDLKSKLVDLNGQQEGLKSELQPLNFNGYNVLNANEENVVKNIHEEQEKGMTEPSETLKQKNEILKGRSELESRMKRKLGRTCFFRFGKRKELRKQIQENHKAMNKIVKSIAPENIHGLSFYSLTPELLKEMPRAQIINIPKGQIKKLDQEQINAIESKFNDKELAYVQCINLGLDETANMNLLGAYFLDDLGIYITVDIINKRQELKDRLELIKPRAMNFIPIKRIHWVNYHRFTKDQARALSMKKMANLNEYQFDHINQKRKNKRLEWFVYEKQKESKDYAKTLDVEKDIFSGFGCLNDVLTEKENLNTIVKNNVECYEAVCDTAQKNKIDLWMKSKNNGAEKSIYFDERKNYNGYLKRNIESLNASQEKIVEAKKNLNDSMKKVNLKALELDLNNVKDRKKLLSPLIKDVLKTKKENTTFLGHVWHKIKNKFRSKSKENDRDMINNIKKMIKEAEKNEKNNEVKTKTNIKSGNVDKKDEPKPEKEDMKKDIKKEGIKRSNTFHKAKTNKGINRLENNNEIKRRNSLDDINLSKIMAKGINGAQDKNNERQNKDQIKKNDTQQK